MHALEKNPTASEEALVKLAWEVGALILRSHDLQRAHGHRDAYHY